MEEIKLNMENLSVDEREQLMKLVEKAQKKEKDVWPEVNDVYYYYSSSGDVWKEVWANVDLDSERYRFGNCFKTAEEAQFAAEKHKVIVELERFSEEHSKNNDPMFWVDLRYDRKRQRVVSFAENKDYYTGGSSALFDSREAADAAIKEIGEDRLKKYYFEVE